MISALSLAVSFYSCMRWSLCRFFRLAPFEPWRQFRIAFCKNRILTGPESKISGLLRVALPGFEKAARPCELRLGALGCEAHISTDRKQLRSQLRIAVELCWGPGR